MGRGAGPAKGPSPSSGDTTVTLLMASTPHLERRVGYFNFFNFLLCKIYFIIIIFKDWALFKADAGSPLC